MCKPSNIEAQKIILKDSNFKKSQKNKKQKTSAETWMEVCDNGSVW
jgi:hypothetical protein